MRLAGMAAVALACAAAMTAGAQKKEPAPSTFELAGILADAKGPLANKVVRVGPVDAKGNVLNIRRLNAGGAGMNPQATSDAQGRFTVTVSRSLFRGYRDDEAGISVYTDLGGGRMSTAHEPAKVKIDPAKAALDVGRVVFEPLKPRG